jgi:sugar lactone lactonase YvrE
MRLYVASGDGLWLFDTTTLHVAGHLLAGASLSSVALSVDGQSLYTLDTARGLLRVSLASGQAQHVGQAVAAPLGIAWVGQ